MILRNMVFKINSNSMELEAELELGVKMKLYNKVDLILNLILI